MSKRGVCRGQILYYANREREGGRGGGRKRRLEGERGRRG
jgi:hypothetical protein